MAIEALKEETAIIFISGLNLHKTPEVVQKAIASDEAMGPTPIIAVFDSGIEREIGVVPYFDMKDVNGFTQIKRALADYRGVPLDAPDKVTYEQEVWKNSRGRAIRAAYVASTADVVTLRLSNGKLSTFEISKLDEAGQNRVAKLAVK